MNATLYPKSSLSPCYTQTKPSIPHLKLPIINSSFSSSFRLIESPLVIRRSLKLKIC
uniref:Uncharacterized protein n=1 Tax=Manihot esculenta TaxID=3983 RepID=A0A2C9VE11_MANES